MSEMLTRALPWLSLDVVAIALVIVCVAIGSLALLK